MAKSENTRSDDFKTPLMVASFTQGLFEVQTSDNGFKYWGCTLLLPKTQPLQVFEQAALEAAEKRWPGKAAQMIKDKDIKSPFLDGDGPQGKSKKTGERHAGYAGNWFIRVSSGEDYRPKLVNQRLIAITNKEELYSGCHVFAVLNAFAWYNVKTGNGVSFGVSMIQKVKDGERLGGGGAGDPAEYFEKIPDEGDAPDSTKSGAGAGGLFS